MGENVHAELIISVDAGLLTALILYRSGGVEVRTLEPTEVFHITGGQIIVEVNGNIELLVDSAAAGRYLIDIKAAAGVPIPVYPFICPPGVIPKFRGISGVKNMCVLYGFITSA